MTYLIDTNIFLRSLIKEDEKSFQNCIKLLTSIKQGKVEAVTCSIILAEIVWTLSSYYKFNKLSVVRAVKSIFNLNNLKIIDNYNHQQTIRFYEEKNIKYIDCLVASIEQVLEKKWIIVSYDKDFTKLPITSKRPEEIIL